MTPTLRLLAAQGSQDPGAADVLARVSRLVGSVPDIIREPATEPMKALLLLAVAVAAALIVVLAAVLVYMRDAAERPAASEADPEEAAADHARATGEPASVSARERHPRRPRRPAGPARVLTDLSVAVLALALAWGATVAVSADRSVCLGCHADRRHVAAKADAHASISCVECHEGGGLLGEVLSDPALRLEHIVRAGRGTSQRASYGHVASEACARCHGPQLARLGLASDGLLRVSHAEPMAAAIGCLDCHRSRDGSIAARVGDMGLCRTCHDGVRASSRCDTCHVGDPATRLAASRNYASAGRRVRLVVGPKCDGCHESQASCDGCHGIEMPHSQAFKAYAHARQATVDIWDNGGKTCGRCHTGRNHPCSACHARFPSHPPSFRRTHRTGDSESCGCHGWDADARGMTFCELCHGSR